MDKSPFGSLTATMLFMVPVLTICSGCISADRMVVKRDFSQSAGRACMDGALANHIGVTSVGDVKRLDDDHYEVALRSDGGLFGHTEHCDYNAATRTVVLR